MKTVMHSYNRYRDITPEDVDAVQDMYQTYGISPELLPVDRVLRNIGMAKRDGLNPAEALHAAVLISLREEIFLESADKSSMSAGDADI